MKKLFLTLAVIFTMGGLLAQTQNSDNATIQATANLIGEIAVTAEQNLEFGDIGFEDPTTVPLSNTDDRGVFFVELGPGNPNVNFVFTLPEELTHQGGDDTGLEIGNWNVAVGGGLNSEDYNEEWNNISSETPYSFNMEAGGGDRQRHVYIGATVTPDEDNWVGDYEGDVTLTVEYN